VLLLLQFLPELRDGRIALPQFSRERLNGLSVAGTCKCRSNEVRRGLAKLCDELAVVAQCCPPREAADRGQVLASERSICRDQDQRRKQRSDRNRDALKLLWQRDLLARSALLSDAGQRLSHFIEVHVHFGSPSSSPNASTM
jgi:hypothetical protein